MFRTDELEAVTGAGVTESLLVYQIPLILEKFNMRCLWYTYIMYREGLFRMDIID